MKRSWKEAFRGKLPLFLLLGGLLAVTAVAGVLVTGQKEPDPSEQFVDLNEPADPAEPTTEEFEADAEPESETDAEVPVQVEPETEETEEAPAAVTPELHFTETDKLAWPVRGNILLDYSMDQTIYFPTLDLYKCNPAVVIQAETGSQVVAPAQARVEAVASDEEIGNYVVLDFGDGYQATIGQLENVQVKAGQYVDRDAVIGFVAAPTKYYVVEGSNIYFCLEKDQDFTDPMDHME